MSLRLSLHAVARRFRAAAPHGALALLLAAGTAHGQFSGVVNVYQPVERTDFCNNLAVVTSASGLGVGDRVLLIQMQGAVIDSSNTVNYGDIPSFGQAGKYELLTIDAIAANIITFREAMVNRYDDGQGIQLVRVPSVAAGSVDGTVTGQAWDGVTGGVVALEVAGTLTLNADIDASGLGFRGGAVSDDAACSGPDGYDGYRCSVADGCGGFKGEGIARVTAEPLGRGRAANGGGGGNDQLTGGGGGSSLAIGGTGGLRLLPGAGDCPGNYPGLGGRTLPYSLGTGRIYLGGGGGAGDGANGTATAGGRGGGIVLLVAGELVGNGNAVRSDGAKPAAVAGADGAGGGGAGGTVVLQVGAYTGPVTLSARGGDGGDVDNGNDPSVCAGPGGGGSGGAVWPSVILPGVASLQVAGGQPGATLNANAPMLCGNNGAQPGASGDTLGLLDLVAPTTLFTEVSATVPGDTFVCPQGTIQIGPSAVAGTGTLSYLWNTGDTTRFIDVEGGQGPRTYTVTVSDERGCGVTRTITVTSGQGVSVSAQPAGLVASGQSVTLTATQDPLFVSYTWAPDSFLSNTTQAITVANPSRTITYCVTAVDTLGCVTEDCVEVPVDVFVAIPNAFTPNGDGLNDVFHLPEGLPCDDVRDFRIYDRWGTQVFGAGNGRTAWDGTFRGKEAEIGSYIYVARAQCEDGRERVYRGTVTVVR